MVSPVTVTLPRITDPVVDPKTGMVNEGWYRYFETLLARTGGDVDAIEGAATGIAETQEQVAQLQENTITAGRGLEGGGLITDGVELRTKQDGGWVASTGAGNKVTPYVQYVAVAASAAYVQAEATATRTAVAALSARYVALEKALIATEALDT